MIYDIAAEHTACFFFIDQIKELLESGSSDDLSEAVVLTRQYNTEHLEPHLRHEEQTVFAPLLRKYRTHFQLCLRLGKEHGRLRFLMDQLQPHSARAALMELTELLASHTQSEDDELLPLVRSLFDVQELQAIADYRPIDD